MLDSTKRLFEDNINEILGLPAETKTSLKWDEQTRQYRINFWVDTDLVKESQIYIFTKEGFWEIVHSTLLRNEGDKLLYGVTMLASESSVERETKRYQS